MRMSRMDGEINATDEGDVKQNFGRAELLSGVRLSAGWCVSNCVCRGDLYMVGGCVCAFVCVTVCVCVCMCT